MITTRLLCTAALAVTALAGCAEAQAPTGTPTSLAPDTPTSSTSAPAPTSSTTTTPAIRTLAIEVTGNEVSPEPAQVDLAVGETLSLVITADAGSEVHVHGFGEIEEPVTPGVPVTIELTGDTPGLYEVELHDPDLLLLQVAVR